MVDFATRALRVHAKADSIDALRLPLETMTLPDPTADEVVVEVAGSAVNPSDVKATLGFMAHAVFPRTPGRDFAGTVIAGPKEWVGQEVFGSSGELGIHHDGAHATHVLVEAAALVPKPASISLVEAAGIGVPFVTAMEGFRRAGLPKAGEVVLVLGITGKVGQAAAQIATWRGARVIGVARGIERFEGYACAPIEVIDPRTADVAFTVRAMTDAHGADIVFNTVGDPYFQDAHKSLAKGGRQILIAAIDKIAQFNIFEFYRGRHTYVGVDSLAMSSIEAGDILKSMLSGFASGALRPFPILPHARYALADAHEAYKAALGSSRDRIVLVPK